MKGVLLALVFSCFIIRVCPASASAVSDTAQVINLNKKAWDLKFSQPDSAKALLEQSLAISEDLDFMAGKAEALKISGILSHMHGDLEKAMDLASQALNIFTDLKNESGKASCLNLLGIIHYSKGKYPQALAFYIDVLKIHEALADSVSIAKVYNNIGSTYYRQEEDAKALEFYEKAIKMYQQLNFKPGLMDATNNVAMVLMEREQYAEALQHYKTAEQFAAETGNKKLLASIYQNMALCFRYQHDDVRARSHYEKSYALKSELEDVDGICSSLTGLAILARNAGDSEKAIQLANTVLKTSLKSGLLDRTNGAYEILYQSYADLKNFTKAYEYYGYYSNTRDSLMSLEKVRQISEIQTKYETEKKEQQILLLTKEAEVQAAIKNRAVTASVLLAVVLILGAYGFRLKSQNAKIRHEKLSAENRLKEEENLRLAEELRSEMELNKVQAEKHKMELDYKNREMTSAALYVVQRNEILSDLKEKMTTLAEDKLLKETIKPLVKIIDNNLTLDNDWENLKLHFDQVHPGFFERLKAQFPELTQTELKHIAYMKINLASKEIARLLNISVKAIQMSRYRMKKKMGLPEEVNLIDHILNF